MAGTGVGKFSSTAGSNTANMTVNFAENMAPSNVNNAARELMGHMRDMYEQLGDGYFEYGDGDGTYTIARVDADSLTVASGSDLSAIYFAGRKIRVTDGGANVVEGTIASTSHGSSLQTINMTGITLASGTPTKVEIGIDTAVFGGKIILDDDGDTYIEAPTDDTIDIYVAGAKDFVITANTLTAESGSSFIGTLGAQGTATSVAGIPFFYGDTGSIYTHDVSGTDDTATYNTAYGLTALDAVTTADYNVAVGYGAGGAITTSGYNTFVGANAGLVHTTLAGGAVNTGIGYGALTALTTGGENVALGGNAGGGLTTAEHTIFIGHNAGDGHDAENDNIGIGKDALGGPINGGEYNVAIGSLALDALTSGDQNVAIGYAAGGALQGGGNNVFIGNAAGTAQTSASSNVLIGGDAGAAITTGGYNTFVGYGAGDGFDAETHNLGIGSSALGGPIAGGEANVAVGNSSLAALTSADYCVAVGYQALSAVNSGGSNVGIGRDAGLSITTGIHNIMIGEQAGDGYDTESYNIGIGSGAIGGGSLAGAEYNVAVGTFAGDAITSGDNNAGVGHNALTAVQAGTDNVGFGSNAGDTINGGSANICIGSGSDVADAAQDFGITIGYAITAAANDFSFGKASNIVTNDFDADANWSRSSDVRKKQNIYDQGLGLDFINDLRTVRFQWKPSNEFPKEWNDYSEENNMDTDVIMHGFIAQEVKESLDKHATDNDKDFSGWKEGDDGMQHTSREMFVIPLIKAVQELSAEVKALKQKIGE